MTFLLCLAAFFGSYFFTYLIRQYALTKNLVDIPNLRSSHAIPTPRGGGLSVVIVYLSILLISGVTTGDLSMIGIVIAGLAVAGIGFLDDHQHVPARWRLLVHTLAAILALVCLSSFPTITIFNCNWQPHWFGYALYTIALVWLLNLYNFMDGIDGIASVETINVTLSAAALLFIQGASESSLLLWLCAAMSGFLVWNWPHAKIFMGDACSGFLGFILGVLALMTSATGAINLWSWLILLGLFISDATFTLIKRLLTGQVWYEAHSSHAYQHYARQWIQVFQQQGFNSIDARTQSHRRINGMLTLINLFWLLPLAIAATFYPFWAILFTIVAFIPLLLIAHFLKAGSSK